jgi:hypothetical protein
MSRTLFIPAIHGPCEYHYPSSSVVRKHASNTGAQGHLGLVWELGNIEWDDMQGQRLAAPKVPG